MLIKEYVDNNQSNDSSEVRAGYRVLRRSFFSFFLIKSKHLICFKPILMNNDIITGRLDGRIKYRTSLLELDSV